MTDLIKPRTFSACAVRIVLALLLAALLLPGAAPAKKKKKKLDLSETDALVVGTVLDPDEQPAAGVTVKVTSTEKPDFMAEAESDAKGQFSVVIPEPSGEYHFHLESAEFAPFEGSIPLTEGERMEIGFRLLDRATGQRQAAVKAFNAGAKAYEKGDLETAEAKFLEALEADPGVPQPRLGLADVYFEQKRLDAAAPHIDAYLEQDPENVDALALAYMIHRDLGNEERTEQLIDALGKTEKARALATQIYNQGVAVLQRGDNAGAIAKFERAALLDPELADAHSALATLRYNAEQYEAARAHLDRLFALAPEHVQGRRIAYLIHDARGTTGAELESAFEAYAEVDRDGAVDLLLERADLDFRNGEVERSIAQLDRVLALRPESAEAHYRLGLAYMSADQTKAKKYLEKFLQLAPDHPDAADAREMLSYL